MANSPIDSSKLSNKDDKLVIADVSIGNFQFRDMTVKEINLGESLLTPALQTLVRLQSYVYSNPTKIFEQFKNQRININMRTKDGAKNVTIGQTVYRLDNREMMPLNIGQTEEFSVHACDQTLLEDAKHLMSRSFKCKTPKQVVSEALQCCMSSNNDNLEDTGPARDYIAENIHPFQVITQQANAAVNGNDPSFTHFMNYNFGGGPGQHRFRSLKSLSSASPKATFRHYETGVMSTGKDYNSANENAAIAFSFPCDFDLLTDLLNGLDENGRDLNTGGFFNPSSGDFSKFGQDAGGCGLGGTNYKVSMSNKGTAQQHNACESNVEQYLLKRQGRMSLLDKDKVALRLLTKWRPDIHAGDVIRFEWWNKKTNDLLYGSGDYLVSSLIHNIQLGGFSTTTFDCVSTTVGRGVV